jgi:hypothetical protein
VKYIDWDQKKNDKLKIERGVSFEDVMLALIDGRILGKAPHPNRKKYSSQQIYIVQIDDYAFVVPFVEDKEKIFLKTIFPSRKYTKIYLEQKGAL